MLPPRARGDGHDLFGRRLRAVLAAIAMQTRRIEMAERARQSQPRGRRGGKEAVECRPPKVVEGIEGAPEGGIIALAGLHAGGTEAREGLILEKMGDAGELLGETAQPVEHQGCDRMAGGHKPPFWVLLGGASNDCRDAEFCQHARNQPQVI